MIDLQLEDAPLIVKKGMMGDKCASCNQVLVNNNANSSNGSYLINLPANNPSGSNQGGEENNRYKLRTIQDNSYKYGTGSYSRVLSNANPSTLNEDLRLKNNGSRHFINTSVQLPDIANSSSSRKGMGETPMRRKDWSLQRDDKKDNSYGNMINEEFDKRIVKGDNLIKASNKYYNENVEKKK